MASIQVDGHEVPIVFLVDDVGYSRVLSHLLHVRFRFVESSIYIAQDKMSETGKLQQSIPVERSG